MEGRCPANIIDVFVESRPRACQHKGGHCFADSGWAVLGSVSNPPACKRSFCCLSVCLPLTDAATRTPSSRQQDRTCSGAAATTKPDPAPLRRQNRPEQTGLPGVCSFIGRRRWRTWRTWRWWWTRSRPSHKALFCSVASPRSLDSQPVGLIIATLCTRLRSCAWTPLDRGGDARSAGP